MSINVQSWLATTITLLFLQSWSSPGTVLVTCDRSYNILFFTLVGSKSHVQTVTPAVEALSKRGHNVTYLTFHAPAFADSHTVGNVTVVLLEDVRRHLESHQENVFVASYSNVREFFRLMKMMTVDLCDVFLEDKGFQRMVSEAQAKSVVYDVVIMDPSFSDCGLALVWLLGSPPFIYYATTGLMSWIALSLDIPTPFSYVPMITQRFSDHMSFGQRMSNTFQNLLFWTLRNYLLAPVLQAKIQMLYPAMPPLLDIGRNASLAFANSHSASLDYPRPMAPFFKEVGAVHCRPPKPLSKDLEDFIQDDNEDGFIYFSFGTYVRGADMPPTMVDAFLNTFRRIRQRVLWKLNANISNLPSNVRLLNWAPQQDLLGHPNIRLFITHFGQLSIQEAIYHGVPLVGMPFFADQFSNMKIAVESGMGERLDYTDYSEEKVYNAVIKVLNNSSYKANVLRRGILSRDRPKDGMDTIVYWIEYVARHRGALHMRFQSSHLSLWKQLLLDIIASTLLTFVIFTFVMCKLWKFARRKWRGRSTIGIINRNYDEIKYDRC